MALKYLDQNGLGFFIGIIKSWGQPELVSGTNIKSLSSGDQNVSILGSGSLQFKTINGTSVIGSNDIALQVPLTFQSGVGLSLSNEDNTVAYALKTATVDNIGGIKVGYVDNGNNFGVKLDSENRAYVTIPNTGGGGETYTIVNTDSNGLAPMISKKGEVGQQFTVLASNNGVPGWYSLPSTAFSTGEGVDVKNNDVTLAWNTRSILTTINSIEVSASLPENPCSVLTLKGEIQGTEGDISGYKITLLNGGSELANVIVPPPSIIPNSDIDTIIADALSSIAAIE